MVSCRRRLVANKRNVDVEDYNVYHIVSVGGIPYIVCWRSFYHKSKAWMIVFPGGQFPEDGVPFLYFGMDNGS